MRLVVFYEYCPLIIHAVAVTILPLDFCSHTSPSPTRTRTSTTARNAIISGGIGGLALEDSRKAVRA